MSKNFKHKEVRNSGWYEREVAAEKVAYNEELKNGAVDNGYVWPSVQLEIFIEGVFTQKPVPPVVEIEIPKGIFRLTALSKDDEVKWLIRNDAFGAICEVNPEDIFKWAIDNYPDGIGSEGYTQIAFSLLTAGCKDDDEKENVFKCMFYGENA